MIEKILDLAEPFLHANDPSCSLFDLGCGDVRCEMKVSVVTCVFHSPVTRAGCV